MLCVYVYRFDMRCANTNDANLEKMKPEVIPDVVSDTRVLYFNLSSVFHLL